METHMENLLLVPVDDSVVFPNMTVTLAIDVGDADRVVLVPRRGDEFADVGTIANVVNRVRLPGGAHAVELEGVERGRIGAASTDPSGDLRVEVEPHPDDVPVDGRTRNLEREYRAVVEELLELRGDDGRVAAFVRAITEPGVLADTTGYAPDLTYDQKIEVLETLDVTERLELALTLQRERLAELQVRARILDDVTNVHLSLKRQYFVGIYMESNKQ
jgi:ATP-dependent Lon protease